MAGAAAGVVQQQAGRQARGWQRAAVVEGRHAREQPVACKVAVRQKVCPRQAAAGSAVVGRQGKGRRGGI